MRCKQVVAILRDELRSKDEQIAALNDRLQAKTLGEYHGARSIAMPVEQPTPSGHWASDPTGLVLDWVPDDAPVHE